jgi:CRISPR-associated endonuclease/helicase Cas3
LLTGGGDTVASLAFALGQAVTHGLDRIIYVIPFTSITEQTADVFPKALGAHYVCVLEHHSAFEDNRQL